VPLGSSGFCGVGVMEGALVFRSLRRRLRSQSDVPSLVNRRNLPSSLLHSIGARRSSGESHDPFLVVGVLPHPTHAARPRSSGGAGDIKCVPVILTVNCSIEKTVRPALVVPVTGQVPASGGTSPQLSRRIYVQDGGQVAGFPQERLKRIRLTARTKGLRKSSSRSIQSIYRASSLSFVFGEVARSYG
jgi:hypothetical protein